MAATTRAFRTAIIATVASGVVAFPAHAREKESLQVPVAPPSPRAERLLVAGGVTGGAGLLAAAIGFSTLGGMYAASPGPALQLTGAADQAEARRTLRLARGMEALAYTGVALTLVGTIIIAVGANRLLNHRRGTEASSRPRLGSGASGLVLRF